MEEEKLIEAIEQVRRDKHEPWRYIWFTFLNGVAQGLGMALGMTIVLGLVIYILTIVIARLVDFPVLGQYFSQIAQIIETYAKHGAKFR